MSRIMPRHHYVPQFLLRQWSSSGRLVAYYYDSRANRVLENAKVSVATACQIKNLNILFGVSASQRDFPETGFFTPHVDTPAAVALQVMLSKGIDALSPKQRMDWARLLISFGVRTPETLRIMGPQETTKAFDLVEAIAKGPPEDEHRVTALIRANMALFKRNFPLNAAMELSTDPKKLEAVNGMTWWIRRWPRSAILIGDRPLLTCPRAPRPCGIPLNDPSCLIVLPISPQRVFFASANVRTRAKVRRMSVGRIATMVNEETIWRSSCTYARDKSLAKFVTSRLEGKIDGSWESVPRR
jgi:hypothetical protein